MSAAFQESKDRVQKRLGLSAQMPVPDCGNFTVSGNDPGKASFYILGA